MSSSMIAVSSLVSFDIFRTYLKPSASDRQILRVSHGAVVVHGFVIAAWTVMMNYSGANGKPIICDRDDFERLELMQAQVHGPHTSSRS
jgi:hypothetical protein